MTKILEEMLAKVRDWPDSRQDDAARLLLAMHEQNNVRYTLTAEQIERVKLSKEQADGANFATDDDIDRFFAKHSA